MNYAIPLWTRNFYTFLLLLIHVLVSDKNNALAASTSKASESTGSRATQTHTVAVGKADHQFDPDVVQADVGDVVEFQFFPTNHSVVRAEYEFPCIPYEMTGDGKTGFFSGFHTVDKILSNPPTFLLSINDTLPVFFYCSAPGSCIDQRMVGVINPNGSVSLDIQKQKAADSLYMLSPGEDFPDEMPSSTTASALMSTSPATLASETAVDDGGGDQKDRSEAKSTNGGISHGAIAGIAIGTAGLVACSVLALLYYQKRRQTQGGEQENSATPITPVTPQMVVSTPQSLVSAHQCFGWSEKGDEVEGGGSRISELPS